MTSGWTAADLARTHLFRELTAAELSSVESVVSESRHGKGEVILVEDAPATFIYIIMDGCVSVQKRTEERSEVVAILEQYDHFGEIAMLDPGPASAAIVAEEDTWLLRIPHEKLRALMERDTALANKLLWPMATVMARRLRQTGKSLIFACSLVEKYRTLA